MHFDLTDEQMMICDSAARLVRECGATERRRERIARRDGFDAELWSLSADLGWLALCVPEVAGGLGGSVADIALLMIELGRGMICDPIVSSAVLCAGLLAESTWEGRNEWLNSGMAGATRLAFANLEPGDRHERPAPRATRLTPSGAGFVLAGAKLVVQDGEGADAYLVTATTPCDAVPWIILIPSGASGLTIEAYPLIDGSRAADLRFEGVAVNEAMIVARGVEAGALLENGIARATVATLAASVGSMESCLDICSDYLKTRQQFGQPIGKFQALQHMLADMLVATHNARSSLYHALSRMNGDRKAREAAVAAAKFTIGQAGLMVSRAGIQLHGGYGVTDEYVISHHHRYLLALEKRFGDSQVHLERLAELTLDSGSSPKFDRTMSFDG